MRWWCEERKIEEMTEKTLTEVGVFFIKSYSWNEKRQLRCDRLNDIINQKKLTENKSCGGYSFEKRIFRYITIR